MTPDATRRWRERPVAAEMLRAAVLCVPVVLAAAAGSAVLLVGPAPSTLRLAVAGVATLLVLALLTRAARRLLPLAVLLQLGLLFPDRAPDRLRLALAAGSTRELVRARDAGDDDDAARAAERLLVLLASIARHDAGTRRHSERVRAYVDLLAEELALGGDDRDRLRWAALVHDLGKTAVDARVLRKPARLDDDEWAQVRLHPAEGARLAAPLQAFLGPWYGAIGDHHERYDGSGYPRGLAGEQISFAGRVVAVADAFEVMTSARPYSRPVDPDAARAELVRCAGGQFDPQVVRALLAVPVARLRRVLGPIALLALLPAVQRSGLDPVDAVGLGSDVVHVDDDVLADLAGPLVGLPDGAALADGAQVAPGVVPTGTDAGGGTAPTGSDDTADAAGAAAAQR